MVRLIAKANIECLLQQLTELNAITNWSVTHYVENTAVGIINYQLQLIDILCLNVNIQLENNTRLSGS